MAVGQTAAAPSTTIAAAPTVSATTPAAVTAAPEKTYAFEVVSMRRNISSSPDRGATQFGPTPDGYRVKNMTLHDIILTAFAPQIGGSVFFTDSQIKGSPEWADSEHYDIDARVSEADRAEWQKPEAQKAMLRAMLQAMLADRCKLAVHHEVKESAVYSLELAKGGPKFKESTPDEVFPAGIKLPWGGVVIPTRDGMRMYGTTMATFATVLAERADVERSIQDKTGLTGKYDITLKAEAPLSASPGGQAVVSESELNAAMLAGVEALGLKLVTAKAQVEMLMIDHLERPSEN
jgi:uncharacterized protein (TIGR03435 family)